MTRRLAKIAANGCGGNHRHSLLVGAADFGRARGQAHFGDRRERHRSIGARVDHEIANFLDGRGACIDAAHQHVDFLFLQAITRRHVAAHVRDHAIGDVAHRQPELRGALLVEQDLDFGMAAFDARADVLERTARFHALAHGAGGDAETLEVVAGEDHLDRRRQREQRRPREFVLRAGNAGEPRAQLLDRELFAFLVDGRPQLHVEIAGVLARVDRIGIQAIARAGHRVGAFQSRAGCSLPCG